MAEEVLAPLAGKVISIEVAVGETVEEDDEIVVVEAMKMEQPIYAPCDGKIVEIRVSEGDQIEEDDIVAIIE